MPSRAEGYLGHEHACASVGCRYKFHHTAKVRLASGRQIDDSLSTISIGGFSAEIVVVKHDMCCPLRDDRRRGEMTAEVLDIATDRSSIDQHGHLPRLEQQGEPAGGTEEELESGS